MAGRIPVEGTLSHVVAEAVGEALDRRFKAMVFTSATVGLLVALMVSLPLTVIQNNATDVAARARAQHNCRLLTTIADVMGAGNTTNLRRGGFISTDAHLYQAQALKTKQIVTLTPGPLKSLFTDPQTRRLNKISAALGKSTTAYWQHTLIPTLLNVAHVDCAFGG